MKKPLNITIPITKVDEEQRMVYGYATVEEIDAHGEIISYEASKKAFSNWIGNIREMHQDVAVGKALEVEYDDEAKGVWLGARISESNDGEQAWIKVKEGVYAGFSIGGRINDAEVREMAVKGKKTPVTVITDYSLGETSLVDNPAAPSAVFQMVKSVEGGLYHDEQVQKRSGRPIHWWEKMHKYSDSQQLMKGGAVIYNEDSMSKKRSDLVKNLYDAKMLTELAMCLSDYIWFLSWRDADEDTEELKSALQAIQNAAAAEVIKPEEFPDLDGAIENATKALNISKREDLEAMSESIKERDTKKTVVGQEDRDAEGKPVVADEEVAADEATDTTDEVEETDAKDETDEDTKDGDAEADTKETEDKGKKGKGKKDAGAEFTKSTDMNDFAKTILSGVEDMVEKATQPLKEKIEQLEKTAAPSKIKSSYVEKGSEMQDEDDSPDAKLRKEFDDLIKRSEELETNPSQGTHQERLQIGFKLRKLSRQLDPASVQKHAEVKARFNTSN